MSFQHYFEEFLNQKQQVQDHFTILQSNQIQNDKQNSMKQCQILLSGLDQNIKHMEMETQQSEISKKSQYLSKIKQSKQEFEDIKRKFKYVENDYYVLNDRDSILRQNNKINDKLIQNGQTLSDGIEKLENVKRNAYEAENIAIAIQGDLQANTQKIQRTINTTKDIHNEIGMADNIINEMERRNINNQMVFKFTIGLIAVGLIFVIIYNIYSAMHSNSK